MYHQSLPVLQLVDIFCILGVSCCTQEGLKKYSPLSTQLCDHVWVHAGRGIPAGDVLTLIRASGPAAP